MTTHSPTQPPAPVPEALRLAAKLYSLCVAEFAWPTINEAAVRLRRYHARVAELEAEVEYLRASAPASPQAEQPGALTERMIHDAWDQHGGGTAFSAFAEGMRQGWAMRGAAAPAPTTEQAGDKAIGWQWVKDPKFPGLSHKEACRQWKPHQKHGWQWTSKSEDRWWYLNGSPETGDEDWTYRCNPAGNELPAAPGGEAPAPATAAADVIDPRLAPHVDLLTYVLQDDVHNRLTPRVIDIAYSAFMGAKRPNAEDGGPSDWFNDTKPMVSEAIDKLRRDLMEDRAKRAAQGQEGAAG